MIYDLLENIGRYRGICPNLDTAIRFLMDTDLNTLPTGKTEIDGERVYLQIMDAVTHELTEDSYEIHRAYMDIQIDLDGCEVIGTALDQVTPVGEYSPDFQAVRAKADASCTMGPGRFIICMPCEAHAPGGLKARPQAIRKCVVKVDWEQKDSCCLKGKDENGQDRII